MVPDATKNIVRGRQSLYLKVLCAQSSTVAIDSAILWKLTYCSNTSESVVIFCEKEDAILCAAALRNCHSGSCISASRFQQETVGKNALFSDDAEEHCGEEGTV